MHMFLLDYVASRLEQYNNYWKMERITILFTLYWKIMPSVAGDDVWTMISLYQLPVRRLPVYF